MKEPYGLQTLHTGHWGGQGRGADKDLMFSRAHGFMQASMQEHMPKEWSLRYLRQKYTAWAAVQASDTVKGSKEGNKWKWGPESLFQGSHH